MSNEELVEEGEDVPAAAAPAGQSIEGDDVVTFDAEGNELSRVPLYTGGGVEIERDVVDDDDIELDDDETV